VIVVAHLTLHDFTFQNTTERDLTLEQVFERILRFMQMDPRGEYKFMIGTDSQTHHDYTLFVTAVVIQRMGRGVWGCIRKKTDKRKMGLKEKILMETIYTQEVASYFDQQKENKMIEIILPYLYQGASFKKECHLDIGKGRRNKTREFANEMMAMIESIGFEPVIKPDAYVASGYANHYTK
jgi:hypothetical protein